MNKFRDVRLSQPKPKPTPISILDLAGRVLVLATAAGGCLFVIGWRYANAYFTEWGVPFASLQIPKEFIASYGLTAITTQLISFCLYTFLGVLLLILFYFARPYIGGDGIGWVILFYMFITFILSGVFGRSSGRQSYETLRIHDFRQLPTVIVLMKSDWLAGDNSGRAKILRKELSEDGCYRQLFVGSDTIWLIRPYFGANNGPSSEAPGVLRVPSKAIDAMRVLMDRQNCP
jgi:hypothetical protein